METTEKNGGGVCLPLVAVSQQSEHSRYPRVVFCYFATHPTVYDMDIFCADCARDVADRWGLKDLEAKGLGLGYSGRAHGEFITIEPLLFAGTTARVCPNCCPPSDWVAECKRLEEYL